MLTRCFNEKSTNILFYGAWVKTQWKIHKKLKKPLCTASAIFPLFWADSYRVLFQGNTCSAVHSTPAICAPMSFSCTLFMSHCKYHIWSINVWVCVHKLWLLIRTTCLYFMDPNNRLSTFILCVHHTSVSPFDISRLWNLSQSFNFLNFKDSCQTHVDLCIPNPSSVSAQCSAPVSWREWNRLSCLSDGCWPLQPVASDIFTPHTTVEVSSVGWSAIWFFFFPLY